LLSSASDGYSLGHPKGKRSIRKNRPFNAVGWFQRVRIVFKIAQLEHDAESGKKTKDRQNRVTLNSLSKGSSYSPSRIFGVSWLRYFAMSVTSPY